MHGRRHNDPPARALLNSGRLPISERFLKIVGGVGMIAAMTVIIMSISFIPDVAPDDVNFWRVALAVPGVLIATALAVVGPRLNYGAFQLSIELMLLPLLALNFILIQITPATIAVLFNMFGTFIYAGYFFRRTALGVTLLLGTAVALTTLFVEPASQTPHLGAFLVVYIPTFILMSMLLHLQNSETIEALNQARRRAMEDPLTGLANLRALEREATKRFSKKARADKEGVSGLILLDLDNFKSANSTHGHVGGDHALRVVGRQLLRIKREDALVARVGGDEFAILVRSTSREGVEEAGEIYRAGVRAASSIMEMPGVELDAAVGYAVFPEDGRDLSELLDKADGAMYAAKGEKRHPVPNLENKPGDSVERPAWLDVERMPIPEPPATHASLESVTGGNSARFGSFSLYARTSAIAWAFGAVVLGISLLMPDAPESILPWWVALFGGLVLSVGILKTNAHSRTTLHGLFDCCALGGIAVLIYLTGGLESTLPPLLLLFAASQAWFWNTERVIVRMIGPVLVALSPLLYDAVGSGAQASIIYVTLIAESALIVSIVVAMYYDRVLLSELHQSAERLATTDPLTGISNRRAFSAFVEDLLGSDDREDFAIVMLDLDNFKNVNTERGHRHGDTTLRAIASALESAARDDDCVARVGGDEFAAVLPGVGIDGARRLAERFVQTVSNTPEARDADVGASAGFALYPLHGETLDQLAFTADSALMAVKASGKGSARVARVVSAV